MDLPHDNSTNTAAGCRELHVVGVGASAGGLEALEAFFRAIPADSGMAFVVVQHLSPDFKSHMEELLARQTNIPVYRVDHGVKVERNCIYLIPAKMEMVIDDGKLLLTERSSDRSLVHPIDTFFQSLATDIGRHAIGVILSGTGSDGSRGVKSIHAAGGLVIVQDEVSAKFDGMPLSARETGAVDLVLTPSAIAEALVRYTQEGISREKLAEEDLAFGSMEEEAQILHLLHRKSSLDFAQYKSSTVGRRIYRRLQLSGLQHMAEYVERLMVDDHELNELYKDLLIGVTKFFRDSEAFEALRAHALTKWLSRPAPRDMLRIWVAACASGEEAYSIAILLDEEMRRQKIHLDFKIFATDAHSGSLNLAGKGIYSVDAVAELSPERIERYFSQTSNGYQISRDIRNRVVFATHNILNDAPFTQMDLVTCRNMLIYLQPAAQKKALSMFHFALKADGFLFLGPSETCGELAGEFQSIDQRWRIFTKRRDVRLPVTTGVLVKRRSEKLPYASLTPPTPKSNRVDAELLSVYEELHALKMGCSILVGENGEMLHLFGDAERFLRPRRGRPSNLLLEMIHESLKSSIASAWHQAVTKRKTVRYASTAFTGAASPESIRITMQPLNDNLSRPCNVLVEFEPALETAPPEAPIPDQSQQEHDQSRMESLESQLQSSQENLQATIEEMETSNEELQASNEELIASNEELQSTNEELHSVNEELYTVNAEHQRRVEELALANDDMDNLLATTRVGVIFLDDGLYIRRFTPEIARVFRLEQHDTGRSMEQFAHVLNHPSLLEDLQAVLQQQEERELTVRDRNGTPYLLRILPYQSGDATRGVVLTLIDISSLTAAQSESNLRQLAIESAVNGIIISDPLQSGNPITYANQGFLALTGYERDEVLGRNCKFLQGAKTDPETIQTIRAALDRGEPVRVTLLNYRKDGSEFWNDLQITPVFDLDGEVRHFVGVQHDITNQMTAQKALQEANAASLRANEAKNSFLATMSHELRTPLTAVLGFADILRSESEEPDYLEKVDTIKRNGTYLLALLNDILDLSKVEAGKMRFERQRVDIRRVMADIENLMSNRSQDAQVALQFEYATQLPAEITADEVRVRQILVNLISNALKFTEAGHVTVSTVVNHDARGRRLEISVEDTGIGITPKQMERLFQPFSQANKQTTRKFGGTGLGLSISKRLAEGMGGTILAASRLGKGSRFTLLLPLSQSDSEITSEAKAPGSTPPHSGHVHTKYPQINSRVLLADDRRDVWQVGKYFLEKCGADVTIVENGQQAVTAVKRSVDEGTPFQLILMDMQMPVMSGREAVAVIREQGIATPIIALTADAMEGEREACIAMGCNEYFPKPIDGPRLMKMVATLISADSNSS
ncbi:chemotaxis protein CheB [Aureliella helgolandensis]|uniref:histidine kinase n=1 Tax=Aureliella helgolandensis TaxID=2527968 RepID=A0A518GD26_9BACT|nr:chemotaxis protein CheB [Aureliella helgolandensis]QDV26502.1 Autoinducer 2 sensor kinase/phosphatase LuxQ [Aureliella helgolandensis]